MASSNQLKSYLKEEVQKAVGFSVSSDDFDKIMGAFAIAIDKYLKNDIKVQTDIIAKGLIDVTNALTPPPGEPAQNNFEVETKTTTQGKLI